MDTRVLLGMAHARHTPKERLALINLARNETVMNERKYTATLKHKMGKKRFSDPTWVGWQMQ